MVTLWLGVCVVRGGAGPLTREGFCVQVGKSAWDSFHAESEKNSSRTACVCDLGQVSGFTGLCLVCKWARRAERTAGGRGLAQGTA